MGITANNEHGVGFLEHGASLTTTQIKSNWALMMSPRGIISCTVGLMLLVMALVLLSESPIADDDSTIAPATSLRACPYSSTTPESFVKLFEETASKVKYQASNADLQSNINSLSASAKGVTPTALEASANIVGGLLVKAAIAAIPVPMVGGLLTGMIEMIGAPPFKNEDEASPAVKSTLSDITNALTDLQQQEWGNTEAPINAKLKQFTCYMLNPGIKDPDAMYAEMVTLVSTVRSQFVDKVPCCGVQPIEGGIYLMPKAISMNILGYLKIKELGGTIETLPNALNEWFDAIKMYQEEYAMSFLKDFWNFKCNPTKKTFLDGSGAYGGTEVYDQSCSCGPRTFQFEVKWGRGYLSLSGGKKDDLNWQNAEFRIEYANARVTRTCENGWRDSVFRVQKLVVLPFCKWVNSLVQMPDLNLDKGPKPLSSEIRSWCIDQQSTKWCIGSWCIAQGFPTLKWDDDENANNYEWSL